jgi:hypothetical protein
MSAKNNCPLGANITALGGAPLPEWAQFMIDLGRYSGRQGIEQPQSTTWRLITVPHRNFAAGLFALGFLETMIPEILRKIDEIDITKLKEGQSITWRRTDNSIAYGTFIRFNSTESPRNIEHTSKATAVNTKRTLDKVKEFNFSPYFGAPFSHHRMMCRNLEFFTRFFPMRYFDLLCNTVPTICLIGRPALWEDLRSLEFAVGGISGCLDDLLRVSGDNEHAIEDVSHFLTRYVSPDRDVFEEVTINCAVFDGSRAYPKLKNFVSAKQNLVVLDRWESGAMDSANSFAADYAHAGALVKQKPSQLQVPETIEYAEWSTQ